MDNDAVKNKNLFNLIVINLLNEKEFADTFIKTFDFDKFKNKTGELKIIFEAIKRIYNSTKDIPTPDSLKNEILKLYNDAYNQLFSEEEINFIIDKYVSICRKIEYKNNEEKRHTFQYIFNEFKNLYTKIVTKLELSSLFLFDNNLTGSELLKKIKELENNLLYIHNIGSVPNYSASFNEFLINENIRPRKKHGFFIIDHFCEGYEEGEVALFLGPSGGGKTLVCINSVVDSAKSSFLDNKDELSVFIGYECPKHEALQRAWAAATMIDVNRLVDIRINKNIKTTISNEERELLINKFKLKDKELVSEKERIELADEFMKNNVVLLDFSGGFSPDKTFVFGFGGIPEIVNVLETIISKTGKKIKYIAIDWAGLLLDRAVAFSNYSSLASSSSTRSVMLKNLIDEIISNIAAKFKCFVLITHQLSGESMRKKPTQRFEMSDAADCKSLHVFTSFGMVMGTVSKKTNSAVLGFRKSRKVRDKDDIIITISGEYGRVYMNNDMCLAYDIGEIIPKEFDNSNSVDSDFEFFDS